MASKGAPRTVIKSSFLNHVSCELKQKRKRNDETTKQRDKNIYCSAFPLPRKGENRAPNRLENTDRTMDFNQLSPWFKETAVAVVTDRFVFPVETSPALSAASVVVDSVVDSAGASTSGFDDGSGSAARALGSGSCAARASCLVSAG